MEFELEAARLEREAQLAAQRTAARAEQAQKDQQKAQEWARTRPLAEHNDYLEPPPSPASARRRRGQEAREEELAFERELMRMKGREAIEEQALEAHVRRNTQKVPLR